MNEPEIDANLVKGGENVLMFNIRRSRKVGLSIQIKAAPEIEEFFRDSIPGNTAELVENWGRNWIPPDGAELRVWGFHGEGAKSRYAYSEGYYLLVNGVGSPLFLSEKEVGLNGGALNLSFLRLKDISSPQGVTFKMQFAGDDELLQSIASKVQAAAAKFYRQFIQPIDVTVFLSKQQTRG